MVGLRDEMGDKREKSWPKFVVVDLMPVRESLKILFLPNFQKLKLQATYIRWMFNSWGHQLEGKWTNESF